MEGGSRRQRWINNHGRSQNKKPPRAIWQPTIPSWEKDFCRVVGLIEWETLLQKKKWMHFCDNVINWNDSAGKEAFLDGKQRFWSKINGFPCDIPLPDPDLYIQEIDWDSEVNPELMQELECLPGSPTSDHDPVVISSDALLQNQGFFATGWGDVDENFQVPVDNYGDSWGRNWEYGWGFCDNNNNDDAWGYSDDNNALWGDGWDNTDWVDQPGVTKDGRA